MNKITSLSVSAAVVGALIVGAGFHNVSAKTVPHSSIKPLIMRTKVGRSTVGAFLNDVLPKFQNSYWGAPVMVPGSAIEPLVYSAFENANNGNVTIATILFDIKDGKVYPADQISQEILKGDFPTAYALMLSEASGAAVSTDYANGNQEFVNVAPIFNGNVSTYAAMATLRSSSLGRGGEADSVLHASISTDDSDSAVSDGGGK